MENYASIQYTKHYIFEALLKLMKSHDFESITITDIVKAAGVGRTTFYRLFTTKESVIKYYFDKETKNFDLKVNYIPRCQEDYYDLIVLVFKTLYKHKELFLLLLKAHLESLYFTYLDESFINMFNDKEYLSNEYVPTAYAGLLFSVSMKWIKNDCRESIEQIADAIFITVFSKKELDLMHAKKHI